MDTVSEPDRLIIVVDSVAERARKLKAQIEFMDAPAVCTATPATWQAKLGDRRLAAIFLSGDLPEGDRDGLLDDVGRLDPNVPIVMVEGDLHA